MRTDSSDFRSKAIQSYEAGCVLQWYLAQFFGASASFVQDLL